MCCDPKSTSVSKGLHFKYTFKIYWYQIGTFCNQLCIFQVLNHFSVHVTSVMWIHCTNVLATLCCMPEEQRKRTSEKLPRVPSLWDTGSKCSQVSLGRLGSSSGHSTINGGLRREQVPLVKKGGKRFVCQKQLLGALLVTATCPPLAQVALQILHQWNITLNPSSMLHCHCCSLLCYFR